MKYKVRNTLRRLSALGLATFLALNPIIPIIPKIIEVNAELNSGTSGGGGGGSGSGSSTGDNRGGGGGDDRGWWYGPGWYRGDRWYEYYRPLCCEDHSNPRQKRILEVATITNLNEKDRADYRPTLERMRDIVQQAQELNNADVVEERYFASNDKNKAKRPVVILEDKDSTHTRISNEQYRGYFQYLVDHDIINRDEIIGINWFRIASQIPHDSGVSGTGSVRGDYPKETFLSWRKYSKYGQPVSNSIDYNAQSFTRDQIDTLNLSGRYSRPNNVYAKTDFLTDLSKIESVIESRPFAIRQDYYRTGPDLRKVKIEQEVIDNSPYRKMMGQLGIDSVQNDIQMSHSAFGDTNIYVTNDVPELYLKRLVQEGVVKKDEFFFTHEPVVRENMSSVVVKSADKFWEDAFPNDEPALRLSEGGAGKVSEGTISKDSQFKNNEPVGKEYTQSNIAIPSWERKDILRINFNRTMMNLYSKTTTGETSITSDQRNTNRQTTQQTGETGPMLVEDWSFAHGKKGTLPLGDTYDYSKLYGSTPSSEHYLSSLGVDFDNVFRPKIGLIVRRNVYLLDPQGNGYRFFRKEKITVADAYVLVYRFLLATEGEVKLSKEQVEALNSAYSLNLTAFTEEETNAVKYLIAKGIIDGDDKELSSATSTILTNARGFEILYKVHNKDYRKVIIPEMSEIDKDMARKGFAKANINLASNDTDMIPSPNLVSLKETGLSNKEMSEVMNGLSYQPELDDYETIYLKIPSSTEINEKDFKHGEEKGFSAHMNLVTVDNNRTIVDSSPKIIPRKTKDGTILKKYRVKKDLINNLMLIGNYNGKTYTITGIKGSGLYIIYLDNSVAYKIPLKTLDSGMRGTHIVTVSDVLANQSLVPQGALQSTNFIAEQKKKETELLQKAKSESALNSNKLAEIEKENETIIQQNKERVLKGLPELPLKKANTSTKAMEEFGSFILNKANTPFMDKEGRYFEKPNNPLRINFAKYNELQEKCNSSDTSSCNEIPEEYKDMFNKVEWGVIKFINLDQAVKDFYISKSPLGRSGDELLQNLRATKDYFKKNKLKDKDIQDMINYIQSISKLNQLKKNSTEVMVAKLDTAFKIQDALNKKVNINEIRGLKLPTYGNGNTSPNPQEVQPEADKIKVLTTTFEKSKLLDVSIGDIKLVQEDIKGELTITQSATDYVEGNLKSKVTLTKNENSKNMYTVIFTPFNGKADIQLSAKIFKQMKSGSGNTEPAKIIPGYAKFQNNGKAVSVISKDQLDNFGIIALSDKVLYNKKTGQYAFINTHDAMTLIGNNVTHYKPEDMMVNAFGGSEKVYYNLEIIVELIGDVKTLEQHSGKEIYISIPGESFELVPIVDITSALGKSKDYSDSTRYPQIDITWMLKQESNPMDKYMSLSALKGQASNFIYFKDKTGKTPVSALVVYRPNTNFNLLDISVNKTDNSLSSFVKNIDVKSASFEKDEYMKIKESIISRILIGSKVKGDGDVISGNYKYDIYVLTGESKEDKSAALNQMLDTLSGSNKTTLEEIRKVAHIDGFGDGDNIIDKEAAESGKDTKVDITIRPIITSHMIGNEIYEHDKSGNLFYRIVKGEEKVVAGLIKTKQAVDGTEGLKTITKQNFRYDKNSKKILFRKARFYEGTPEGYIPLEIYAQDSREFGRLERADNKEVKNFKVLLQDGKEQKSAGPNIYFPNNDKKLNIPMKATSNTTVKEIKDISVKTKEYKLGIGTKIEMPYAEFTPEEVEELVFATTQWEILGIIKKATLREFATQERDKDENGLPANKGDIAKAISQAEVGWQESYDRTIEAVKNAKRETSDAKEPTKEFIKKISKVSGINNFYSAMQIFKGTWDGVAYYDKNVTGIDLSRKELFGPVTPDKLKEKIGNTHMIMFPVLGDVMASTVYKEASKGISFVPFDPTPMLASKENQPVPRNKDGKIVLNILPQGQYKADKSGKSVYALSNNNGTLVFSPVKFNPEDIKNKTPMEQRLIPRENVGNLLESIGYDMAQTDNTSAARSLAIANDFNDCIDGKIANCPKDGFKDIKTYGQIIGKANDTKLIKWYFKPSLVIPAGTMLVDLEGNLHYFPYKHTRNEVHYCADIVNALVSRIRDVNPETNVKRLYISEIPKHSVVKINDKATAIKLSDPETMGEGKVSWVPSIVVPKEPLNEQKVAMYDINTYTLFSSFILNIGNEMIPYMNSMNKIPFKRAVGKGLFELPSREEIETVLTVPQALEILKNKKGLALQTGEMKDAYNITYADVVTDKNNARLDVKEVNEESNDLATLTYKTYLAPTIEVRPLDANGKEVAIIEGKYDLTQAVTYEVAFYHDVSKFQVDRDSSYVKYLRDRDTPADEIRTFMEDADISNLNALEYKNAFLASINSILNPDFADLLFRIVIPSLFIVLAVYVWFMWVMLHFQPTITFIEIMYERFGLNLLLPTGAGWLYKELKVQNAIVMSLALGFFGVVFSNGTVHYIIFKFVRLVAGVD